MSRPALNRPALLARLSFLTYQAQDRTEHWTRELAEAQADPAGRTAESMKTLADRTAAEAASVRIYELVSAFIEQVPKGADLIGALAAALEQAKAGPAVTQ